MIPATYLVRLKGRTKREVSETLTVTPDGGGGVYLKRIVIDLDIDLMYRHAAGLVRVGVLYLCTT